MTIIAPGYTHLAEGRDLRGVHWEVGVRDSGLIVTIDADAWQLHLTGAGRDRFADAVTRAMMPGQAVDECPETSDGQHMMRGPGRSTCDFCGAPSPGGDAADRAERGQEA